MKPVQELMEQGGTGLVIFDDWATSALLRGHHEDEVAREKVAAEYAHYLGRDTQEDVDRWDGATVRLGYWRCVPCTCGEHAYHTARSLKGRGAFPATDVQMLAAKQPGMDGAR